MADLFTTDNSIFNNSGFRPTSNIGLSYGISPISNGIGIGQPLLNDETFNTFYNPTDYSLGIQNSVSNPVSPYVAKTGVTEDTGILAGIKGAFNTATDWVDKNSNWLLGGKTKDGYSMGLLPTAVGLFSGISNYQTGKQQLGLAKKQFDFQRDTFRKNLEGQVKSYNNALQDIIESRTSGNSPEKQRRDREIIEQRSMRV